MIQVNRINKRNVCKFRKFKLEKYICFLTSETVEKNSSIYDQKDSYKNSRIQQERACSQFIKFSS